MPGVEVAPFSGERVPSPDSSWFHWCLHSVPQRCKNALRHQAAQAKNLTLPRPGQAASVSASENWGRVTVFHLRWEWRLRDPILGDPA